MAGRPKGSRNKTSLALSLRAALQKRGIDIDDVYYETLKHAHPDKKVQLLISMLPYVYQRHSSDGEEVKEFMIEVIRAASPTRPPA